MIITAANQNYSFFVKQFKRYCEAINYEYFIYDLGGLGEGRIFQVKDKSFQQKGYYNSIKIDYGQRFSRALHKPTIIKNALSFTHLTYMDADAFPIQRFDEVFQEDFDLGVTVDRNGYLNAGVLFVKPSAHLILDAWIEQISIDHNDEIALTHLLEENKFNIKKFPSEIYNFSYFPNLPSTETKILHFKHKKARHYLLNYARIY